MRTTVTALVFVALAVVACSDRVPAPTTPTPSPQPGYPPAPVSELPEGVLFVNNQRLQPPVVFRIEAARDPEQIGPLALGPVSADGLRAVAVTYGDRGLVREIGILTVESYEPVVQGEAVLSSPVFAWSKTGKGLPYTVPRDPASTQVEVWLFDAETGEKRLLTAEPGDHWLGGWTAAGDVLESAPDGLALLGSTRRPIALPEPGSVLDAAVSPDGQRVAVKLGEYEQDADTEVTYIHSTGIWVLGLTDGAWREILDLADEPAEVLLTIPGEVRWSPDGRRIAVHRTRMDERSVITDSLSVLDVRTGEETRVHDLGWGWESWSPDGRYLAYMYYSAESGSASELRLGLLGPDGEPRGVEANVRQMAWTKDGRLLVDIPGHLSLLDPETMNVKEVRTASGEAISALLEAPVWSPSGRYVALSTPSGQYRRSSLYVIDTEQGTAELLLDGAGFAPVAWLRE